MPIVSTRGFYSLRSGKRQNTKKKYTIKNRTQLKKWNCPKELVIIVHGFRNSPNDALRKFTTVKQRLKALGYNHKVIGYSYGANVIGANNQKTQISALKVGQKIAILNGSNLAEFILDYKKECQFTRIRLIGHSLGAYLILHALLYLSKKQNAKQKIESVHLFGAAIDNKVPCNKNTTGKKISRVINRKFVNYYAPTDEVLNDPTTKKILSCPLGLSGSHKGRKISSYSEKRVKPYNHRFASYMHVLKRFP